jgi:peptide/nickel transport system permease protein
MSTQIAAEPEAPLAGPEDTYAVAGRTPRQLAWSRFKQDHAAMAGLMFIIILVFIAIIAPLIARAVGHGPNELFGTEALDEFGLPVGPNADLYFGADTAGRDVFIRVLYGTRTSLIVALAATGVAVLVGIVLGLAAGYFGGKTDTVISRATDIVLSVPSLLFAIGIVAVCSADEQGCLGGLIKPGLWLVVFVISLFTWPYITRIVRGNTLSLREREFIEASRSLGASHARIMFRDVLPNLVAPIIVYGTLLIPQNILFEAALSFLGLGVPQDTPSWGGMLKDAARDLEGMWWLMVFPGMFLIATTLAFNLFGDGLRDALDPKSNR